MSSKNIIRAAVLLAVFAWPGVEAYRCHVAKKQLAAAQQLHQSVLVRLEAAREGHVQMVKNNQPDPVAPVQKP